MTHQTLHEINLPGPTLAEIDELCALMLEIDAAGARTP